MLIVNADDFGRSEEETDVILRCYKEGRVSSVTAMVFMQDSARAANLAQTLDIGVGLHLNLTEPFTGEMKKGPLREYQHRVAGFLSCNKYSVCIYHPLLRKYFRYAYEAQVQEFVRLYGRAPSHVDGHRHGHLCLNMLIDKIIPAGEKVRRSFSFWPGEKSAVNRAYRRIIDQTLARRFKVTDFFFCLAQCIEFNRVARALELSKTHMVELMTHPIKHKEYDYLMSDTYAQALERLTVGTYAAL